LGNYSHTWGAPKYFWEFAHILNFPGEEIYYHGDIYRGGPDIKFLEHKKRGCPRNFLCGKGLGGQTLGEQGGNFYFLPPSSFLVLFLVVGNIAPTKGEVGREQLPKKEKLGCKNRRIIRKEGATNSSS